MNHRQQHNIVRQQLLKASGLVLLCVGMLGCGGRYQAPVADQGETLPVTSPEIVASGNTEAGTVVERSRPLSTPANPARSAGLFSRSLRTEPAPVADSRGTAVSRSAGSGAGSTAARGANVPRSYQVQAGDSLFSIAYQFDLDYRELAAANGLRPPYTIFVGQQLSLNSADGGLNTPEITAGTAVTNNSVARASASGNAEGSLRRQPIGGGSNTTPSWRWPHSGALLQRFGQAGNKGLDIGGGVGDPVFAASDGEVVYAGIGVQGAGNLVIIRHNERFLSAYAHNQTLLVQEGAQVVAGQQIAELGRDGSGEAKLHFEIRLAGQSVDPQEYLPAR